MPIHKTHAMDATGLRNGQACVTRTVELACGHFTYLEQGEATAPLVLLAHGFPDTPKTFLPLMSRLCMAGYRCVAPFLRGYAPSIVTGAKPVAVSLLASVSPRASERACFSAWS